MKKAFSYTGVFVVGFVACALALKTLGDPSSLLPGADTASKQAVLASLNTTPRPEPRSATDSVVADAAAKLEPAIVEVHVTGKPIQQAASPFGNDPIFRRFFGGSGDQAPVVPKGAGSGVIISSDGYIMTNDHVVSDAATVKVSVGGDQDKEYTARVVGTDPVSDIAVLKINPDGAKLTPAVLGDSDGVRVGDWAIAVGNPLDVGETVTLGIISAKNRTSLADGSSLEAEGHQLVGGRIQTDAAINPGNSGGALADIDGRVVGINEAILTPTGGSIGIGLAIPINDAKKIAAQLIKNGKVTRPYLGVSYVALKDVDDLKVRRQYGLPLNTDDGVVVYPNTPAADAGLQVGDLIVKADGQTIATRDTLNTIIQSKSVGQTLVLQISRKGVARSVNVALKERPASFGQTPQQPSLGGQTPDDQSPDGQSPDDGQPANPFAP